MESCTGSSSADMFAKAKDIDIRNMVSTFLIIMFHVKPYEASEAGTNIFVPISEPIKVGLEESKHNMSREFQHYTVISILFPSGSRTTLS